MRSIEVDLILASFLLGEMAQKQNFPPLPKRVENRLWYVENAAPACRRTPPQAHSPGIPTRQCGVPQAERAILPDQYRHKVQPSSQGTGRPDVLHILDDTTSGHFAQRVQQPHTLFGKLPLPYREIIWLTHRRFAASQLFVLYASSNRLG
jgi:hypothetical protein